jgi:hypothetical protein
VGNKAPRVLWDFASKEIVYSFCIRDSNKEDHPLFSFCTSLLSLPRSGRRLLMAQIFVCSSFPEKLSSLFGCVSRLIGTCLFVLIFHLNEPF